MGGPGGGQNANGGRAPTLVHLETLQLEGQAPTLSKLLHRYPHKAQAVYLAQGFSGRGGGVRRVSAPFVPPHGAGQ